MAQSQINKGVQEFTQYLNDCQMDAQHKRLALHALSGPGDGTDFGPLLSETHFNIHRLRISGGEVVGRLWIFASQLVEPDQTNAKNSMISALKDSYYQDSRVCNEGKTQRLVVGVLQGRLQGVNIELGADMQLPTAQAVEMFFNVEAHRNIDQLAPLLEAANRFCDVNPLVNRAGFIREIEIYAQNQEIVD